MQKLIVILGQTATGKSALAVKMAKKFKGEIISADSRQVYTGLDIGTGKITPKEMRGVPHYMIDIVKPKDRFTVAEYKDQALEKIEVILAKNKIPIITGGTGFYIDAITKGVVFPTVPPNKKLRKELEQKNVEQLLKMLKKLDPIRAKDIENKNEQNNKVRIIRAIEIAKALGKVPKILEIKPKYKFIKIGVMLPKEELAKKINTRVRAMFKSGLLKEIQKLKRLGVSEKRLREFGFEYNKPTVEKVITQTVKYAKRQNTWFKREKNIKWFSPSEYKEVEKYIKTKI